MLSKSTEIDAHSEPSKWRQPQFVKWHSRGIGYVGETLAVVSWDKPIDTLVVRYWYDPEGDPPRKPYTLVHIETDKDGNTINVLICEKPEGYVKANY